MKIAIVDGYSTGGALVAALRERGATCIHVRSTREVSEFFLRSFHADHYEALLDGSGDTAALAAVLSSHGVERVVAGTESGVILADTLTHLLNLPGNRIETVAARRDKVRMGAVAAAAGIAVPLGDAFTRPAEAARWFVSHGLTEAVVKPSSSGGTDNVHFCHTAGEVEDACAAVLGASSLFGQRNTVAVVQERVRGVEYYANTVSYGGVHRIAELWRYTKRTGSGGGPIYDYEEPVPAASAEARLLKSFVGRVLDALGVTTGAAHTEVMVGTRGPVLIESGARLGGGTAPRIVAQFSGTSQTGLFADSLIDPRALAAYDDTATTWSKSVRNVALINPAPGLVSSLDWAYEIEALPTVVYLSHGLTPGAELPATTTLMDSPGYLYLASEHAHEIERDYRTLRKWEEAGLYIAGDRDANVLHADSAVG